MKDSLAVLAIRTVAEVPDLSGPICAIIQMMGLLSDSDRLIHFTRFRGTLKGLDTHRLSAADAFAALKVQVDDLTDRV